jgi:hypothetical protein
VHKGGWLVEGVGAAKPGGGKGLHQAQVVAIQDSVSQKISKW